MQRRPSGEEKRRLQATFKGKAEKNQANAHGQIRALRSAMYEQLFTSTFFLDSTSEYHEEGHEAIKIKMEQLLREVLAPVDLVVCTNPYQKT